MRSKEEIAEYEYYLDSNYLSNTEVMTDLELHNISVKMDRAVNLYAQGLSNTEIKERLQDIQNLPKQKFESALDEIQRQLIDAGFKKGTKEFESRENAMLRQWAKKSK